MVKRLLFVVMGIILAASAYFTADRGLLEADRMAYASAMAFQPAVDQLGFDGFRLADYPVSFYNGREEMVIHGESVTSRTPILGVLAATTWQVDDHYEVFMPTYTDMRRLFQRVSGSDIISYGEVEHVAVLWHETFHAWHMSHHETDLNERYALSTLLADEEGMKESFDEDEVMRRAFTKEMALLREAVKTKSVDVQDVLLERYFEQRDERLAQLPKDMRILEDFYELSEGGAQYVEAMVYLEQTNEAMYNDRYLKSAGEYAEGFYKYYRSGFLKYLLLDMRNPDWKQHFGDAQNVTDQLIETLGGGD